MHTLSFFRLDTLQANIPTRLSYTLPLYNRSWLTCFLIQLVQIILPSMHFVQDINDNILHL